MARGFMSSSGRHSRHDDEVQVNKLVEIAGELIDSTDKAYLFNDGEHDMWLPKSLCTWDKDQKVMLVPEWKAKQEGLI